MGLQTIDFGGTAVSLQSDRTILVPEHSALLVADLHLGKDATFRQAGVPVPAGSSQRTLDRLAAAIEESEAKTCYVLGDFVHAANSLTDELFALVERWLTDWTRRTAFVLVRGNHDRGALKRIAALPFADVAGEARIGALRLLHHPVEPRAGADDEWVVAGHVHPCFRLASERGRRGNVPCFYVQPQQITMPAFGEFTGSFAVRPRQGETAYLVCEDELVTVRGGVATRSGSWPR